MTNYTSNELVPSSEFAKQFGRYLSQVTTSTIDKFAILKNNRIEAVLVSKDDYERMQEALELLEHTAIYEEIKQRELTCVKTISFEDMAAKHNINLNKLD